MGKASRTRRPRQQLGSVVDTRTPVAGHCTYPSLVELREDIPQGTSGFGEPLWVVEQQHTPDGKTRVGWSFIGPPPGTTFNENGVRA
jgi:hypothetical protein